MDPIFNLFKIKFTKLDEILSEGCTTLNKNSKVNVFINFESILKKLSSSNIEEYLRVKGEERNFEMISNIINLASHYRLFFAKNGIYSKIFIYLNYPFKNMYKNRLINADYRTYYENKYAKNPNHFVLNEVISSSLPLTKIILEYVEGVYLIQSDYIENSLVPYVISKDTTDNVVNFILTNDKYEYQYVNNGFYILKPNKDDSLLLTKDNAIEIFKRQENIMNDVTLNSRYLPFILSLLGNKERNIEKIKRIGLANIIKMINRALKEHVISEGVYNINILSNIIKEEYKSLVLNNFYCTDIETQFQMLNIKDLYVITSQVIDKFDNETLKKLNDQYFSLYPIQLLELTSGSKFLKKEKKNIFE